MPINRPKFELAVRAAQEISLDPQMLDTVVHIPNSSMRMRSANALTFNDAPWITDNSILSSFQLVHSEIPNEVAEKLGGQSLRKLVSGTDKGKNASALSCPSASILMVAIAAAVSVVIDISLCGHFDAKYSSSSS